MRLSRRDFLELVLAAGAAGGAGLPRRGLAEAPKGRDWQGIPEGFYDTPPKGNVHLLHFSDIHGQLKPVYFREPNVNLGLHDFRGKPPLLVGEALLEHYGLERRPRRDGRFERVRPEHSWNSAHRITSWYIFNLNRHSDHHYLASRPYPLLRHFDEAPQLPAGYPSMVLLALVPPLWRAVMDPRVDAWNASTAT